MYIKILRKEKYINRIELDKNTPDLVEVSSEIVFIEDYYYEFHICDIDERYKFDSIELYIGDMPIPVYKVKDSVGKVYYKTEEKNHFLSCYDLTRFCIILDSEGEKSDLYSKNYHVATRKIHTKDIEKMLQEIEEFSPDLLIACFSHTRHGFKFNKSKYSNQQMAIQKLRQLSKDFRKLYSLFRDESKVCLEEKKEIVDIRKVKNIGVKEIEWILKNQQYYVEINKESSIKYKDRYYISHKIQTNVKNTSYKIYENKMILSFINYLIKKISEIKKDAKNQIHKLEDMQCDVADYIPKNYEIPSIAYRKLLRSKMLNNIYLLENIEYDFHNIYHSFVRIFGFSEVDFFTIPKMTFIFKEVYHYKYIFNEMVEWWHGFNAHFVNSNYLLINLKKLSDVYEYYCLMKLIKVYSQNGYKLISQNISSEESDKYNGKITFQNNITNIRLTIFYEPKIYYNPHIEVEHDLIRIKPIVNRHPQWDFFCPDFLLKHEFLKENKCIYGVYDAKFSTISTLYNNKVLQDIVYKYFHLVKNKKSLFTPVTYIWLFYPGDKFKMWNEQKPYDEEYSRIYPSVGAFPLGPLIEDNKFKDFIKNIQGLINNQVEMNKKAGKREVLV